MTVLYTAVSGVNQTEATGLANSAGGWVSGTLASLAATTTATVIFDLGSGWKSIRSIVVSGANLTSSATITFAPTFSADSTGTDAIGGMTPNSVSGAFAYSGTGVGLVIQLLVTGRYLRIPFLNGATPQGATAKLVVTGIDT